MFFISSAGKSCAHVDIKSRMDPTSLNFAGGAGAETEGKPQGENA
jgi:hypothetical protein